GGSFLPFISPDMIESIPLLANIIFVVKLWVFIFLFIWVRGALPRVRIDQLLDIGWKRLLPLAIINVIIVVVMFTTNPEIFGVFAE
ncbi:MAG: NADH-quinone oxidoreductase subunit H, partial [Candidatus Hodarchaeales archaeon]